MLILLMMFCSFRFCWVFFFTFIHFLCRVKYIQPQKMTIIQYDDEQQMVQLSSGITTILEHWNMLCAPLQNIITICISCYHVNLIIFTLRQVLLLLRCYVAEVMILLLLHLFLLLSLLHSYSYWSQRLMTIRCN